MSSSEDEDIRRAIALSLQESSSQPKPEAAIIDLVSSDEDDDLDAPVHTMVSKALNQPTQKKDDCASIASLVKPEGEGQPKSLLPSEVKSPLALDSSSNPQSPPVSSVLLGLDRAQMEAERLARVKQKKKRDEDKANDSRDSGKRKASISQSEDGRQVKARYSNPWQRAEEHIVTPTLASALSPDSRNKETQLTQDHHPLTLREASRRHPQGTSSTNGSQSFPPHRQNSAADSSKVANRRTAPEVLPFNQQQARQASGVQYPDGVVKRTWVKGTPQEDDMIRIEEVLQKDDLELAVLSTFQVDPEWVSSKLLEKTKVIWVINAIDEEDVS
jgi:hypothetical protein